MTQQEAIAKLREIWTTGKGDPEAAHSMEDALLIDIIVSFGWSDFATEYDQIDATRWYA